MQKTYSHLGGVGEYTPAGRTLRNLYSAKRLFAIRKNMLTFLGEYTPAGIILRNIYFAKRLFTICKNMLTFVGEYTPAGMILRSIYFAKRLFTICKRTYSHLLGEYTPVYGYIAAGSS